MKRNAVPSAGTGPDGAEQQNQGSGSLTHGSQHRCGTARHANALRPLELQLAPCMSFDGTAVTSSAPEHQSSQA